LFSFLGKYRTTEREYEANVYYAGKHYKFTIPRGFKYRPSLPIWFLKLIGMDIEVAYKLSRIHDYMYVLKITSWSFADGWLTKKCLNHISLWKVILLQVFRPVSLIYWVT
jgi:hypothetical protein